MSWEALGAIGEVAGAVAVVITLIYLTQQLRQNALLADSTLEPLNRITPFLRPN